MKKFFFDWIVPLAVAAVVAVLINKFLFFNISVPTASMYPTIKVNDRLLVTRVYNPTHLREGDLVVFFHEESNEKLIKRLIGLPGDKITIEDDGTVYVNGKKLNEPYVKNPGGIAGVSYVVPEDCYFFLGDNRSNSQDSRYWQNTNYVPKKDIIGKAQFTIYPFNRIGKV